VPFFFFQAEDGIRDRNVTGVQTCALPIWMITGRYQQRWGGLWFDTARFPDDDRATLPETLQQQGYRTGYFGKVHYGPEQVGDRRSEERRVGKECGGRGAAEREREAKRESG